MGNMLAHQLQELPPFANFWEELPALFDWLEGRVVREELASVPQQGEETDDSWTPPATVWTWGEDVPVESLRFAAANHLCVDLGYGNSVRRIEPYAFRRTKAGKVLLCAVKVQTRESRTYRLDRTDPSKSRTSHFIRRSVSKSAAVDSFPFRNWREQHPRIRSALFQPSVVQS